MKHPNEQMIETYVHAQDQSAAEHSWIREHLSQCEACRAARDFLISMDAAIASSPGEPGERAFRFAQSIARRPRSFLLEPFESRYHEEFMPAEPFVLAAHSATPPTRFRAVASLISEDETVLLRIVYDADGALYHLFLQTTTPVSCSTSIIEIPSWRARCVTNPHGHAELRLGAPPEEYPEPDARVSLPIAELDIEVDMSSQSLRTVPQAGDTEGITCSLEDLELVISVVGLEGSPPIGHVAITRSVDGPELHEVKDGVLRLPSAQTVSQVRASFFQ